jgi:hypothetical protein
MSVQTIAVINKSTKVSNAQVGLIVQALNTLLPQFCNAWYIRPTSCTAFTATQNPSIPYKIYIFDTPDVGGVLGYHSESGGIPYGKVFVSPILAAQGGGILVGGRVGAPTVSQVLCHEVFELLLDPNVNTWWVNPTSTAFYAAEACDPVQGNAVIVSVQGQKVWLSDYILPKWSDVQQKTGPYNYLNTLKAPLTVDKGGYLIQVLAGNVSYIFGTDMSDYTKQGAVMDERAPFSVRVGAAAAFGISIEKE